MNTELLDANVTVFHNIATDTNNRPLGLLSGYSDGHPLVPVARYDSTTSDLIDECERAFSLFNGLREPKDDHIAVDYQRYGNRSLSVGDVVRIDDDWFACTPRGWNLIIPPKWIIRFGQVTGTTPLKGVVGIPPL